MKDTENPPIQALVEVMSLVPSHRRMQLERSCELILASWGMALKDHRYLFDKRPKRQAVVATGGIYLPPRLSERRYRFNLMVGDGENNLNPDFLVTGLTSLNEIAKFCDRIPETVELWLSKRGKMTNPVVLVNHNRLEGMGHVIGFWEDKDASPGLPELFASLEALRKQPNPRYARKY